MEKIASNNHFTSSFETFGSSCLRICHKHRLRIILPYGYVEVIEILNARNYIVELK